MKVDSRYHVIVEQMTTDFERIEVIGAEPPVRCQGPPRIAHGRFGREAACQ